MKIAVIGAGAMGSLYGSYLSMQHDVCLIDNDLKKVETINQTGILIREEDGEARYHPSAAADASSLGKMDLVLLFVKALYSESALENNRRLIGPDTYLMTLQNGAGHEDTLRKFASDDHIIIGTTQHNSSLLSLGHIHHGGAGLTSIGSPGAGSEALEQIAKQFRNCGLETNVSDNIQKLIWKKLFTNVSASVLTGILQVNLGFLLDNSHGWSLTDRLLKEAVAVANGDGMEFSEAEVVQEVRKVLQTAHEGYTSIYADLRDGRLTEVDTISGAVVRAAHRNGVPAPTHELIVELVHAMEDRNRKKEL